MAEQDLLGPNDIMVMATMINTLVLNREAAGERSPVDEFEAWLKGCYADPHKIP
jgi:hypothetical protein